MARYDDGYPPPFFVSVDSKGFGYLVSPLEAILTRCNVSVDFKRLRGLHNHGHRFSIVVKAERPSWVTGIPGLKTKKRQLGCRSPIGCVTKRRVLQEECSVQKKDGWALCQFPITRLS